MASQLNTNGHVMYCRGMGHPKGIVVAVSLAGCGGIELRKTTPSDHYDGVPVYLKRAVRRDTWKYETKANDAATFMGTLSTKECQCACKDPKGALLAHEVTYGAEADYRTLYLASAKYMLWGTRTLEVKIGEDGALAEAAATSTGTAGSDLGGLLSGIGALLTVEGIDGADKKIVVSCTQRTWLGDSAADPMVSVSIERTKPEPKDQNAATR